MSKIGALFHNEIIKMRKRVSVLVIMIIMIVSIIGISGLIKMEELWSDYDNGSYGYFASDYLSEKEYLTEDLNRLEKDIKSAQDREDTTSLMELYNEKIWTLTTLSELELRIQYTDAGHTDFRDDLIGLISSYMQTIHQYTVMEEAYPGTQDEEERDNAATAVTELTEILSNQDYTAYVTYNKDLINAMTDINQEEKNLLLEKWDILLKLDPSGGIGSTNENSRTEYARTVANTVESLAKTIIYERNFVESYSGEDPVTPKQIELYKDKLAAIHYCIDQDIEIANTDYGSASIAYNLTSTIANALITLLLIILAGSLVSREISTGSIKSLIIAPVRRWKIFTAKLLALLSVSVLVTLIKYLCIIATQSLLWPDTTLPYVYASSGTAHSINYYLYQFAYCFAELMPIFMVAIFAFMLSVTTRNTALSVGLPMGIYFGGSLTVNILNLFSSGEWLKFIPFNHMDLAEKLFPKILLSNSFMQDGIFPRISDNISAAFTAVYILVLSLSMLYIAFDSFTRRDI